MTLIRLVAYNPNGASQGPLPTPSSVQAGFVKNDVGALTLSYHPDAARSDLLGKPMEVAVEVSHDLGQTWAEPVGGRFLYLRDGRDPIKTEDAWAIEAPGYLKRLEKALVGTAGLTAEGRREYVTQTPGAVLLDLWSRAQGRGALEGMTATWTATQDSAGTPWPASHSISYEPGAHLLAVLQGMGENGWVDFRTSGRSVQVYVADHASGMARDQTLGAAPVTLRFGRDLTEAPFRRTWEALADTAVVLGDDGVTVTRINPAALKPWGVQETYVSAGGVGDAGTLSVLGDAALTYTDTERTEHTLGLEFATAVHMPFRDYLPGDWVLSATTGLAEPARMRLQGITLTRDANGAASGNVTLNDRFLDADVLQNRRIQAIIAGATQSGSGAPPSIGVDILAPGQAAGLTAASAAYVTPGGLVRSQITLNWNDVATNADNTPTNDVDHYEVWGRVPTQSDWRELATTTVSQWTDSPFDPGVTWEFRVRAVDGSQNRGLFSATASTTTAADLVAPPEPSAPTGQSRLGTATITWNGLTVGGGDMVASVPDFRYVTAHISQVNGFTPTDANRVGELADAGWVIAGPLDYNVTYYARLVAHDSSGNASVASAQTTIVVAPLVDVSNFPDTAMETLYARTGRFLDLSADNFSANLIQGAWVAAGAITADKVSVGTRGGPNLVLNGTFQDLNAAGTQPLEWYTTNNGGAGGVLEVETVAALSGTASAKVTLATNADSAYLRPSRSTPVQEGVVYYARVRIRLSRTILDVVDLDQRPALAVYTGAADANLAPFAGGAVAGPTAAGKAGDVVYTLEGNITVPAGHKVAAPMVLLQAAGEGAGYSAVIDDVEFRPAISDSQITDITPGKIKTGVLQATERIVAGALTGARAELNGVGFQAFAPDGRRMFEVQANSGETIIGDPTGVHLRMGAFNNPYATGTQGIVRFVAVPGSGWGDGHLQSTYEGTYGILRLTSPYTNWATAAFLDVRQRNDGYSQFYLRATEANFSANTFIMGSGDNTTVDFRHFGGPGFTFSDFNMTSRLNLYPQGGIFLVRAQSDTGAANQLRVQGNQVSLSFGGHELYAHMGVNPSLGHFERNTNLAWGTDRIRVTSFNDDAWLPIAASAFVVNSDARMKANATPVKGALAALRALQVYDYDMVGLLPRQTPKAPEMEQRLIQANRGRGVMADEVSLVMPDAVNADETGALSVSLYDLLSTTIAALNELAAEVDTLKPAPPVTPPRKVTP